MTKPNEPEIVSQWREECRKFSLMVSPEPPKCCHTCDHYTDEGLCTFYSMTPPEDFAATPDQCPEWMEEIPF